MNLAKLCRESLFRNFGWPVIDAACSWKTAFARSTPIIVSFVTVAVLSAQWSSTPLNWHIAMPSGEGGNHPIYGRTLREDGFDLCQLGSEAPFLKASMACSFWAWWRGRAVSLT